jgi:TIR domain
MPQPLFFISYSRPHENNRKPIHKAVDKLRSRVAELLGRNSASLDEIGFFDVDNIQNGADWDMRLAPAVSGIGVAVCFCSPGYFNSPYCSNEFDAFRRRFDSADATLQGRTPGPLIPIIWDFDPSGVMPAALKRFHQPGDRNFPKSYEKEGLNTLARLPVRNADFLRTIDTIANYIIKAAKPPRLKPLVPVARFSELASSLHNPKSGPYHLAITVFHENGARWKVDVVGPRIADAVERVADQTRVGWREIVANDQLVSGATGVAQERAAHIFVVPESLAGTEPWKTRLCEVGRSALAAGALFVAADAALAPASDAVARVQQIVPSLAGRGFLTGSFDPNVPDEIDIRLMELVTQLRTRLINEDQPSKVESPIHESAAQTAGVPISSRPVVSGPVQTDSSASRTKT